MCIRDRARDVQDVHPLLDELDGRLEQVVVERVRHQACGRVVGRRDQGDPAVQQCAEEAGDEHRVAGVVRVELVEDEDPAVPDQLVQSPVDGALPVVAAARPGHSVVQAPEEVVEVQAAFASGRQALVKGVHQPALAAAHRAPDVEVAGWFGEGPGRAGEFGRQPGQPSDGGLLGRGDGESPPGRGLVEMAAHRVVALVHRSALPFHAKRSLPQLDLGERIMMHLGRTGEQPCPLTTTRRVRARRAARFRAAR